MYFGYQERGRILLTSSRIPLLEIMWDGYNYSVWKFQIQNLLMKHRLLKIVDSKEVSPTEATY
jgi:hypothetical protein